MSDTPAPVTPTPVKEKPYGKIAIGALVLIAVVLLVDWNLTHGFGLLTRIVAFVGGAVFIACIVLALVSTYKRK